MKALISASFILLFIASCGSSNSKKTYTVSDDHNGTKSPRVKEIITKTADNNKSEEKITRYTYNDENLLVSEKTSYVQKPKDEDSLFISEITYTYTQDKQLKSKTVKTTDRAIDYGANHTEYLYGDILYKNTKLPVVDTATIESRHMTCVYKHTYHLDASNFAISVDKINQTCTSSSFRNPPSDPDFHPAISSDEDKIYSADLSKHTEQYTYFSQSAIATYDKGLREDVAYYSPNENNATKEHVLERTDTYTYENKPYFHKESSSPMVNLPH